MATAVTRPRKASNVKITLEPISDKDRLEFAGWLLVGLFAIFVLGVIADLMNEARGERIFEKCVATIVPIGTLIIGYFFAHHNKK
jgi:hypothetical protein